MIGWQKKVESIRNGYCQSLCDKVAAMREQGNVIYPSQERLLFALEQVPLEKVKVVILGQDPYHGEGQAHGLSFSVPDGIQTPPSLRNIFKEIDDDVYDDVLLKSVHSTDLTRWTEQGVLLLNATLSVEASNPGSHAELGWQKLTDDIIQSISRERQNIVFILWGAHARKKTKLIDPAKHYILEGPHPSPLSAYRGFFGCKHFSKTNDYLKKHSISAIRW